MDATAMATHRESALYALLIQSSVHHFHINGPLQLLRSGDKRFDSQSSVDDVSQPPDYSKIPVSQSHAQVRIFRIQGRVTTPGKRRREKRMLKRGTVEQTRTR
jgi:hypothetical protein